MRSNMLKAALTAIALSTSLAGAYAAPIVTQPQLDQLQVDTLRARSVPPQEVDALPKSAMARQAAALPAKPVMVHKAAYRPRLEHIVGRIGAADHRIRVDHDRGYLTAAEMRRFDARAHDIRVEAMRTARNHHGALPEGRYASLQTRIDRLDRDIHRAATT
jgi:hypothetical protein